MNIEEKIEAYLNGELSQDSLEQFENEMQSNPELKKEVQRYFDLLDAFTLKENNDFVNKQLALLKEQENRNVALSISSFKRYTKKYWRTAAVAASVAFVASSLTYFIAAHTFHKKESSELGREVNAIKSKQLALQNDLNAVKGDILPDYPSDYAGTAFALSNNGLAVTNLHVIRGGKKIFLFTKDGNAYKCELLQSDAVNDLAILKVIKDSFTFSNKAVPYQIAYNTNLAQKVFTLGYPKDEIVYNEGYVSSINGKDGDTSRLQLELPSNPGASGSPVIDDMGNLIGIINSKDKSSSGITYAIKSEILKSTLDSISMSELNSNSLKGKNRVAQIKQLEDFVFLVKVYN